MSFASEEFWAAQYRNGKSKEWYLDVQRSADLFQPYLEMAKQHFSVDGDCAKSGLRVLHVGCGNSPLPLELANRHQDLSVHSVDFESGIIAAMQSKYGTSKLTWAVEDVRSFSLAPESVDVVLDKGCFDALKVGEDSLNTVRELYRVLRPGGVYLCLSSNCVFLKKTLLEMGLPFVLDIRELSEAHLELQAKGVAKEEEEELFLYICQKPFFEACCKARESRIGGESRAARSRANEGKQSKECDIGTLTLQATHWVLRWIRCEGFEVTFHGRGGELFYSSRTLRMERLLKPLGRSGAHGQSQTCQGDEELPRLDVILPRSFECRAARASRKKDRVVVWLPCSDPFPQFP
eukprot:CAMPEP_0117586900 /NCGR_PEP_ID=MMETSP0784-20121206/68986_1 /TAXON_ID=39447 /ORGANISM="" /LENGTH=348 /DNA_ID=CAMNT_0005388067 /DNA_START=131 /DNA_END=1177 /DNA_ORIENTATION=+